MEDVFKISKNIERAKNLFDIAKDRLKIIEIFPKEKVYKIVEEYYEVIKGLLTSLMYLDGYKTLSHITLIEYFNKKYQILEEFQIKLMDTLRKFRNGTLYYGEKISKDFLINNEKEIKKIINKLIKLVEERIK